MPSPRSLRALAFVCTLTPSPAESSSQLLAEQVLAALGGHDVTGDIVRLVDHDIRPGVALDMGSGDDWPTLRQRMLDADIVLISTPTWLGQPSSVAQRLLERLDAELSEQNDRGQPYTYGKVAIAAVVGNEDGAHHVSSILFQALNDLGFTLPPGAVTYWNGEAMHGTDYKDLDSTPEPVASTTATLAHNTAHLARVLKSDPYPPS